MQKWLNDLYAQILKNGFNPGGGGGGSHSGGGQGVLKGKYLGDTYTDAQKQAIANGTFEGLNIGDYWIINDITWRIADFDYYYNVGDTAFTKHHAIIVPDSTLRNARINSGDRTTGGFLGSELGQNLSNYHSYFFNSFGESFIPPHRILYSSATTDGIPSGSLWKDIRVGVMSEEQVYGNAICGVGNGYDVGTQKTQFRLFSLDKTKISTGNDYWVSNVNSSTNFCVVGSKGEPSNKGTSNNLGFRPFACLVGD
jgi:hypothetical protein